VKNVYIKSKETPKTKVENRCKKEVCNSQGFN